MAGKNIGKDEPINRGPVEKLGSAIERRNAILNDTSLLGKPAVKKKKAVKKEVDPNAPKRKVFTERPY